MAQLFQLRDYMTDHQWARACLTACFLAERERARWAAEQVPTAKPEQPKPPTQGTLQW